MQFMVIWKLQGDKRLDVLKIWSSMTPEQRADVGKGLKLIGRWHNSAELTGVAIFEAKEVAPLYRYLGRWSPFMDMDVSPVVSDEESAAISRKVIQDMGG